MNLEKVSFIICQEKMDIGQEVAAHSGNGSKHPIHKICFDEIKAHRV
jgi:hypothetical protein